MSTCGECGTELELDGSPRAADDGSEAGPLYTSSDGRTWEPVAPLIAGRIELGLRDARSVQFCTVSEAEHADYLRRSVPDV